MPRFTHEGVVSLEVVIEEARGKIVKVIDLASLGRGRAIAFAVEVGTIEMVLPKDDRPIIEAPTCVICKRCVIDCLCGGTRCQ